ncbi:MAG: class I SAM-dependent methyltransferase [bacterium]|nr:class I SAM-dependent methyltransferase [bacterium]MDD5755718.1 class I SAM-dependent methyltransferase [bacterium]
MSNDYSSVTEVVGYNVTAEQIQRMYTRYRFAAGFCQGKKVLEVACGSGQGLGYLARNAATVTGVDIDEKLLAIARHCYQDRARIELKQEDAQSLSFAAESFEVVILYEAIYYLPEAVKFIKEAGRVLKKGGVLLICSANRELPDFNPSPYSYRYYSAAELAALLQQEGYEQCTLFGDCHVIQGSWKSVMISVIKKVVVRLNLMPKTMKGKELFKKIFYGALKPMPAEITDGLAEYTAPAKLAGNEPVLEYKVIFALGYKP